MVPNVVLIAFGVFFVWLLILTIFFWQMFSHYSRLAKGANNKNLKSILEDILSKIDLHNKDIESIKKYCDNLERDGLLHVQKIGLHRFNPFKDTGGDQSFVLSLVDASDTGIIISALYSRSGTRWYAKRVVNGKGADHELTDEEKKVLKETKKEN